MKESMFQGLQLTEEGLKKYGFNIENGIYVLKRFIADGQLCVKLVIADGKLSSRAYDSFDGSEYTLHLSPNADGPFVTLVRNEIELLTDDVIRKCSFHDYCGDQKDMVIDYCQEKYGDCFEYLWDKLPNAAAIRRKDNRKWYAVLMRISSEKIGVMPPRDVDVINLHVNSENVEQLTNSFGIFPAYHMSKKHWVTVCLDGSLETQVIFSMIDNSYTLGANKRKIKK